ncbi:MAG: DUF3551 domain-containing protein [Xanthobacteraceae bacterium]
MRHILSVLALCILGIAATSGPASAEITYPWCAQYNGRDGGGGRNCGFWTYEQCRATVSGIGGYCEANAMYRGPQPGMIPPPGAAAPRRRAY